jgi:hypothetical protein
LYILFFSLGSSAGDVVSQIAETALLLVADALRLGVCFGIMFGLSDGMFGRSRPIAEMDKKDDEMNGLMDDSGSALPSRSGLQLDL